jgi:predicted enzyme related to lactoylglutathione lyase
MFTPHKGPIAFYQVKSGDGEHQMLRGFATISYWADDLEAARDWYSDLLGVQPYFVRPEEGPPAYVEFRIGDYKNELGIIDRRYAPDGAGSGPGGVVMYWHVDDVAVTFDRLLSMGAREYEPVTPRGDSGWITASVVDPFGNVLGIVYNPHYVEVLGSMKAS